MPPPRVPERFAIKQQLGSGSFGSVWKAWDRELQREVALKILRKQRSSRDLDRFVREAEVLTLFDHPNIAGAFAFGLEPRPWLAMEYVDGESLRSLLVRAGMGGRPLAVDEVDLLVSQLAEALSAAHERAIVHRDLKPANVLILAPDEPVRLRLVDFGIAKLLERPSDEQTTRGRIVGTPLYLAPEQITGQPQGPWTDIFALGTLAFTMLTLSRPWGEAPDGGPSWLWEEPKFDRMGVMKRIAGAPRPSASALRPELGPEVDEVLRWAMAIQPAERPPTPIALADRLSDALRTVEQRDTTTVDQLLTETHVARATPEPMVPAVVAPSDELVIQQGQPRFVAVLGVMLVLVLGVVVALYTRAPNRPSAPLVAPPAPRTIAAPSPPAPPPETVEAEPEVREQRAPSTEQKATKPARPKRRSRVRPTRPSPRAKVMRAIEKAERSGTPRDVEAAIKAIERASSNRASLDEQRAITRCLAGVRLMMNAKELRGCAEMARL